MATHNGELRTLVQSSSTTISTTPAATTTSTSFDVLSPIYLTIGPIFVLVLFIMIWLLMVPNARRPWSCRSHRKETAVPLRQRGPGDAYEINPDMWRGGGRFVGESTRTRNCTEMDNTHNVTTSDDVVASTALNNPWSEVDHGQDDARQADRPPPYKPRTEQSLGLSRGYI